jgi:hypothetical protein
MYTFYIHIALWTFGSVKHKNRSSNRLYIGHLQASKLFVLIKRTVLKRIVSQELNPTLMVRRALRTKGANKSPRRERSRSGSRTGSTDDEDRLPEARPLVPEEFTVITTWEMMKPFAGRVVAVNTESFYFRSRYHIDGATFALVSNHPIKWQASTSKEDNNGYQLHFVRRKTECHGNTAVVNRQLCATEREGSRSAYVLAVRFANRYEIATVYAAILGGTAEMNYHHEVDWISCLAVSETTVRVQPKSKPRPKRRSKSRSRTPPDDFKRETDAMVDLRIAAWKKKCQECNHSLRTPTGDRPVIMQDIDTLRTYYNAIHQIRTTLDTVYAEYDDRESGFDTWPVPSRTRMRTSKYIFLETSEWWADGTEKICELYTPLGSIHLLGCAFDDTQREITKKFVDRMDWKIREIMDEVAYYHDYLQALNVQRGPYPFRQESYSGARNRCRLYLIESVGSTVFWQEGSHDELALYEDLLLTKVQECIDSSQFAVLSSGTDAF